MMEAQEPSLQIASSGLKRSLECSDNPLRKRTKTFLQNEPAFCQEPPKIQYIETTLPEGGYYKGLTLVQVNGHVFHGEGEYADKQGNVFKGSWNNGGKNGYFSCIYSDGDKFFGFFINNKRNGKGRAENKDGSVYEGLYMDDKRHGEGIYKVQHCIFKRIYTNGHLIEESLS